MPVVAAKYEFFKDANGELRFRLKAPNGEIIASSEGYKPTAAAENGIESGKTKAPDAAVVHESEQPTETPHETAVRKQRKLKALARKHPVKIYKNDGNPL